MSRGLERDAIAMPPPSMPHHTSPGGRAHRDGMRKNERPSSRSSSGSSRSASRSSSRGSVAGLGGDGKGLFTFSGSGPKPSLQDYFERPASTERPGSMDRSEKSRKIDKEKRAKKDKKDRAKVSSHSTAGSPRSRAGSLFPLAHADHSTYISVAKADIYQVQNRLDKLERGNERSRSIATPRSSRRRNEIDAIKQNTLDVDNITKTTSDPLLLKLRLLEHLHGVMLHLECSVLQQTDRSSSRPFEPISTLRPSTGPSLGSSLAPASLSRLPAWLALVERVLELQQRLDEYATDPISTNKLGAGSLTADGLEELEDQITLLEEALGMESQRNRSLLEQHGSALHATLGRLKRAGAAVERIRERGVRHIQQESEEHLANSRKIADTMEKVRLDFEKKLADKEAERKKSKERVSELKDKLKSREKMDIRSGQAGEEEIVAALRQAEESRAACAAVETKAAKETEELRKSVEALKAQLDRANCKRGDDAEYHYQELEKIEEQHKQEMEELRQALGGDKKGSSVQTTSTQEAKAQADMDSDTLGALDVGLIEALTSQVAALEVDVARKEVQVKELADRLNNAEKGCAKEHDAEWKARSQSLQVALDAARNRQRQTSKAHELSMKEARMTTEEVLAEHSARGKHLAQQLQVKEDQLVKLKASLKVDTEPLQALREVLMDQTDAMKRVYDLRLARDKDESSKAAEALLRRCRVTEEKLKQEQTAHAALLKTVMSGRKHS
jgi:hypothetical protein